jgi:hypothetical protein
MSPAALICNPGGRPVAPKLVGLLLADTWILTTCPTDTMTGVLVVMIGAASADDTEDAIAYFPER